LREEIAYRRASHELHGDERVSVGLANLVHRRDAGVCRGGRRARRPQEPAPSIVVVADLLRQDFERDLTP
jgi:hypothetical protein